MKSKLFLFSTLVLLALVVFAIPNQADAQTDVVAFWGFESDYQFATDPLVPDGPNKQDHAADVDNTVGTSANLQQYLGVAAALDSNGGGGFKTYTSPVSGASFGITRTAKWDDLKGGGADFDIGGVNVFQIDKLDGAGAAAGDFGNDALIYLTMDGTGYQDFQIRFDIEGTPGLDPLDPAATDLPESYDIFFRTTGAGGTWFRDPGQNNISLSFSDLDPLMPDPDNQVADSGYQALSATLNNAPQIEIIIGDFAEIGNNEMELDNIEIVANQVAVPEPASTGLIFMVGLGLVGLRRRK